MTVTLPVLRVPVSNIRHVNHETRKDSKTWMGLRDILAQENKISTEFIKDRTICKQ